MVSKNVISFVRQDIVISDRYLKQGISPDGIHCRREWTPKQLKRMRKQRNKWRKRIFNQPSNFGGISHLMGVEDEA